MIPCKKKNGWTQWSNHNSNNLKTFFEHLFNYWRNTDLLLRKFFCDCSLKITLEKTWTCCPKFSSRKSFTTDNCEKMLSFELERALNSHWRQFCWFSKNAYKYSLKETKFEFFFDRIPLNQFDQSIRSLRNIILFK